MEMEKKKKRSESRSLDVAVIPIIVLFLMLLIVNDVLDYREKSNEDNLKVIEQDLVEKQEDENYLDELYAQLEVKIRNANYLKECWESDSSQESKELISLLIDKNEESFSEIDRQILGLLLSKRVIPSVDKEKLEEMGDAYFSEYISELIQFAEKYKYSYWIASRVSDALLFTGDDYEISEAIYTEIFEAVDKVNENTDYILNLFLF